MIRKDLPQYELTADDLELNGISATAFVFNPANEQHFIAFGKDGTEEKGKAFHFSSDEQRIVTGVLLVPEQRIYRKDPVIGEHYVYFTADQITQSLKALSMRQAFNVVNVEHEEPITGVYMIELWMTGETDKSKVMGLTVPPRSVLASFYVANDAIWERVKSGEWRGFSIEGLFKRKAMVTDPEQRLKALLNEGEDEAEVEIEVEKILSSIDQK